MSAPGAGAGATVLVTAVGVAEGSRAAAAALACAAAGVDRASLLIDVGGRPPRPTLLASAAARALEERLAAHLPRERVAARGQVCHLAVAADGDGLDAAAAAATVARGSLVAVHAAPAAVQLLLASASATASPGRCCGPRSPPTGRCWRSPSPTCAAAGSPSPCSSAGSPGSPSAAPCSGPCHQAVRVGCRTAWSGSWSTARGRRIALRPEARRRACRVRLTGLGDESGQALVLALGGALFLIAAALALVAIAGAVTGKGRAQRAADLAAISAARSLRDDLPKLLSPPTLPNGLPNPGHLGKLDYLTRARAAALAAARANGVAGSRLAVSFPDAASFAPVRAKATVRATLREGGGAPVEATAVAEAGTSGGGGEEETGVASGGGYGGPLVYRNGKGMRPDVAAAFDRMAAAAAADGLSLLVVSGFRSDAEQAALFAAHPDPKWVAPPGHSLHRCATELDLGPDAAYGWLAANATRFGFEQRYSWEAWHFGFVAGPAPCSAAGEARRSRRGRGRERGRWRWRWRRRIGRRRRPLGRARCRTSSPPSSGR